MANIQFNLRVPQELKDQIEEASKRSGRSINAEAAYRLERGLRPPSPFPEGYVPGFDASVRVTFDDKFFEETGLTQADIARYVREVIKKDLFKNDKPDD